MKGVYLPVLAIKSFLDANRLDPNQAQQYIGHDLDPNCFILLWFSEIF